MIRRVRVENYKSISDVTLDLGRTTVLIGANGSGKTNILEAIALASAASQNKLDNEFLISRGIRVTETRFMRSAFTAAPPLGQTIRISGLRDNSKPPFTFTLSADESASYPIWRQDLGLVMQEFVGFLFKNFDNDLQFDPETKRRLVERFVSATPERLEAIVSLASGTVSGFLVYAPENSALRTFQSEGQILPLGIRGEGLFAHLKALNSQKHRTRLVRIKEQLTLIDWFETFDIPEDLSPGERSIRIRDRYLPDGGLFDQRSANEGFLFLLFYLTLFISPDTPAFFSIDNIDTSLNPKLCITLLQRLAALRRNTTNKS